MTVKRQKLERTPLILNLFENAASGHQFPGQWKHPRDQSSTYKDLKYWTHIAKLAEKGKLHTIFLGDAMTIYDDYKGPSNFDAAVSSGLNAPKNEPSAPVTAMALVTNSLGFGITFSTVSEHPYHLARRIATLDHLTKGRIGWNIVGSFLNSTSRQLLNGEPLPEHDERYQKTEEYVEVVYKLLMSSWRDDAVKLNKETKQYANPKLVRQIDHRGKYFTVDGPGISEPTLQGFPVVVQAGASPRGKLFAAEHAEVIFVGGRSLSIVKNTIESIKYIAVEKFGRDPEHIKFLTQITPILGKTHEEAEEKFAEILKYVDLEGSQALFAGWTGIDLSKYEWDEDLTKAGLKSNGMKSLIHQLTKESPGFKVTRRTLAENTAIGGSLTRQFVGTASEIADSIEKWVDEAHIDGINFPYATWPETFEDIVEQLIPELQRRGLAQKEYAVPGGTLRENLYATKGQTFLPKDHPDYKLRWQDGLSKEQFESQLEKFQKDRNLKYDRIVKELKQEKRL